MNREQILEYARQTGDESAANLLLLLGPDGYDGTWQDYNELMYALTSHERG